MNHSGFSCNLVESFDLQHCTQTLNATPYHSDIPINAIATADTDDKSPAYKLCTAAYQNIVGSVGVGWLCNNTCPDMSTIHSFLSSYLMHPAPCHMKVALYVLNYINSSHDFGTSFSSRSQKSIHIYLHQPDVSDVGAFTDTDPLKKGREHCITTYSDAWWGSQI